MVKRSSCFRTSFRAYFNQTKIIAKWHHDS